MKLVRTFEELFQKSESFVDLVNSGAANVQHSWMAAANEMVRLAQAVDREDRALLPAVQCLVDYAESVDHRDYDLIELRDMALRLAQELEDSGKQYTYRPSSEGPDGDSWEVFGVYLNGHEDWVAFVVTETVAQNLIAVLNNPALVAEEVANAA